MAEAGSSGAPATAAVPRTPRWPLFAAGGTLCVVALLLGSLLLVPCITEPRRGLEIHEGVVELRRITLPSTDSRMTHAIWVEPDGAAILLCSEDSLGQWPLVSYVSREGLPATRTVHPCPFPGSSRHNMPLQLPAGTPGFMALAQTGITLHWHRFLLGQEESEARHSHVLREELRGLVIGSRAWISDIDGDETSDLAIALEDPEASSERESFPPWVLLASGRDGSELGAFPVADAGWWIDGIVDVGSIGGETRIAIGLHSGRRWEGCVGEVAIVATPDGTERRRLSQAELGVECGRLIESLVDLDADGWREVLVHGRRGTRVVSTTRGGVIRDFDGGNLVPDGLADFDGDGVLDLLGVEYSSLDCLWSTPGSGVVGVISGRTGERLLGHRVATPLQRAAWADDVDGNGTQDVFLEVEHGSLLVLGRR